jgi:hypothetical protein
LNGLRVGKYGFRVASILVEALILLIVAGPIAGAVSPELGSQHYGVGIELSTIQPQLQTVFSSSNIGGTHEITVPAFNDWPFSAKAGLTLALVDGNQTIYQTQPATVQLAPFQSGDIDVSMVFSPALVSEMEGHNVGVGGSMTLSEVPFWTVTVNLAES